MLPQNTAGEKAHEAFPFLARLLLPHLPAVSQAELQQEAQMIGLPVCLAAAPVEAAACVLPAPALPSLSAPEQNQIYSLCVNPTGSPGFFFFL